MAKHGRRDQPYHQPSHEGSLGTRSPTNDIQSYQKFTQKYVRCTHVRRNRCVALRDAAPLQGVVDRATEPVPHLGAVRHFIKRQDLRPKLARGGGTFRERRGRREWCWKNIQLIIALNYRRIQLYDPNEKLKTHPHGADDAALD